MITCFTATSYRNFQKYVEGRSSMTESMVHIEEPGEPLPTFSICAEPEFDTEFMKNELKVPPNLFLFTSILGQVSGLTSFPTNLSTDGNQTLEDLWNQTTIKPDIFAINETHIVDDEVVGNSSDVELFDPINSLWYGRCSSIVLKQPRKANERLVMIFAFLGESTLPDDLVLLIHESPGARFSLVPGDFPSKGTKEERIKLGELKILGITKEVKNLKTQRDEGKCKDYDPEDSQAKCYLEQVLMAKMKNESIIEDCKNATKICLIPQAKDIINILGDHDLDQCTTKNEYDCMIDLLKTDPDLRNEVCPNPCTEITYITISKSLPQDMPRWAILMMYYKSNYYSLLEEYLVFDFSAILVALGGSLGLFLGFSFFQCAIAMINNVITFAKKITGNE